MPRPPTFDHLRKTVDFEKRVHLCLDETALEALDEALAGGDEEAIAKARAAVDAGTVYLSFKPIGRRAYADLIDAHTKPAAEGDEPDLDEDAFAAALVAATCVEPRMSVAEVGELFDLWPVADSATLYAAAIEVNSRGRVVPFSSGSDATPP